MNARVGPATLLAYGLPGLPLALLGIPMYVYLPAFYGERLGLAAVGGILLAARLWDLVSDPLVGALGDRIRSRWGRRKLLMVAGAPLLLLGADRLLRPPDTPDAVYLLAWAFVGYLGWTLVSLPYTAWGAEITTDYDGRASITASREGFMVVGTVLAIAWPTLAGSGQADAGTLGTLAMLLWLTLPVTLLVALIRVPDRGASDSGVGWRHGARLLLANRPFARLLLAYVLNGLANGLPATLFVLFVKHALEAEAHTGMLLLVYFGSGILALPLWLALSRRIGKHRSWATSMLWNCVVFSAVPFLGSGDVWAFGVICVLSGASVAADMALPAAIQADVVDYDTASGGGNRAGLFFGLWNLATKAALAAAVGLAFPLLDWAGFDPANVTARGVFALTLAYGGLPILFKLCATAVVWRFPLDRRQQANLQAQASLS